MPVLRTGRSPGRTASIPLRRNPRQLRLRVDLGAGDFLIIEDSQGNEHCRYGGRGPQANQQGALPLIDLGGNGAASTDVFYTPSIAGNTVTVKLFGATGGHGVDVLDVRWNDQPNTASATSIDCAISEVLPKAFAGTEGNTATSFPWGSTGPMRVMYSYDREEFGIDRAVRICALRFRPDAATSSLSARTYTFQLTVSTGRNPALNLSSTFDDNHGADRSVVFIGNLSVPAATLGSSPNDFVLEVPFIAPFEWDPRCGPLLVDLQYQSGPGGTQWDATTSANAGRIAHTTDDQATVATFPVGGTQQAAMVVELCLDPDIAPPALANTEGNSSSSYPWNRAVGTGMRVQQIYDPAVMGFNGRHRITHLGFRTDNGAAYAGGSYDILITMSNTATNSTTLSSTFASNHGSEQVVVFDGIHTEGARPAAAIGAYAVVVPLQTPFEYNPNNGSLVVDMQLRNSIQNGGVSFDGTFNTGVGVGRVFAVSGPNATNGSVQDFALVMAMLTENGPTFPESEDVVEGSSSSSFPWNSSPMRVMYRYPASQLATNRSQFIQHLAFRPNSGNAIGPATFRCTIDLSLGNGTPLVQTFSSNHGARRTRVFDGQFSVPYTAATSDLSSFPIVVKLDTPFAYPASGDLIVDIRMLDIVGDTSACDGSTGGASQRIAHRSDPSATVADFGPQTFGLTMNVLGEDCNGISLNYGTGCAGANGVPRCSSIGRASLPNPDFGVRLIGGPSSSFSFLVIGLTQANIPLGGGLAGCTGLTGGEIGAIGVPTSTLGFATVPIPLPNSPSFAGFTFYTQWASLDATANNRGLSFSDAQAHTVCY